MYWVPCNILSITSITNMSSKIVKQIMESPPPPHWMHFEHMQNYIVCSVEDRCATWIFEYRQKRIRTLILNFSTIYIKKWKEVLCEKRNSGDVKQIGDFLFDERLKWLHGGYYVITGDQSINQAKNIFEQKKINE